MAAPAQREDPEAGFDAVGGLHARLAALEAENEDLRATMASLARILDSIADPVFVKDEQHRWVMLNDACCAFIGLPREQLLGRSDHDIHPPEEADVFWACDDEVLKTGNESVNQEAHTNRAGVTTTIVTKKSRFVDGRGRAYIVGVIRDVTERVRSEKLLAALALTDALTGLPNRRAIQGHIERALVLAKRHDRPLAVMFLDMDGFKAVNDALGHEVGDMAIRAFAQRLVGALRQSDVVARLGGDEFIVLLSEVVNGANAEKVGRTILTALAAPFDLAGQAISLGASIGIAGYPGAATDAEGLLRDADKAMYLAKKGKNGLCVWGAPP